MKCARAVLLIPAVMIALLIAPAGAGQPQAAAQTLPWLQPKPAYGSPGSGFSIAYGGFSIKCPNVHFFWDSQTAIGMGPTPGGSVATKVPSGAIIGRHYLYGYTDCGESVVRIPFDVIAPPTTTPPPPTTPPPTIPPPVTTTTTKPPVTTRPPTTRPTTTTTATVPSTETTTATSSAPTSSDGGSKDGDDPGDLVFDKPAVQAGDPLAATGSGCTPKSKVTLTARGERVGTATADSTGSFTTPVEFTRIEPGRHLVVAECGVLLTGAVDLILTSSSNSQTGTLVVLVFFLLVTVTLVARSRA